MSSDENRDQREKETFFEFIRRAFGHDEILKSLQEAEARKGEDESGSESAENPEAGQTAQNQ